MLFYLVADQIVDAGGIQDILTKYCRLWKGTGAKLGLDASVLEAIESEYSKQRKRFEEVLNKWLHLDGDKATWGVLEHAMSDANRAEFSLGSLPTSKFEIIHFYLTYVCARLVLSYIPA